MRALLSVANRDGHRRLRARPARPRRRDLRDRRHARAPRRRRHRGRLGHGPDRRPADGRRPGQDLPSRGLRRASSPAATCPDQLAELEAQGIGPIDLVIVNVKPFAPAIGVKLIGIDEAIEMIDVGGAALLGAAARNSAGVAAASDPSQYARIVERAARARPGQPRDAGAAGGRGVQHGRRLPRRDRRLPQPDLRQHLPEPARDGPREGRRPALRREPPPARRVLPRDDPPQRHARRRDASSRATGRRSTTSSTSMPRTGSPATTRRRRSRSSSTPTRSASPRTTSSSRPTGTRSRPIRSPRSAASSASIASWTGRPPARSPRTRTRRSSRPGFSQSALGILRGKPGLELLAVPADPTEGMRDYGIASLDFKRVAGGLLVETLGRPRRSTAAGSRSSPSGGRRSRS